MHSHFPCSAGHVQDWQPCPVDPYSCYVCYHTKRGDSNIRVITVINVCVVIHFILDVCMTSGLGTYQPGSHRRKVTQDFSTFLFSREGFRRSFPSLTVKSNSCVLTSQSFSILLVFCFVLFFCEENLSSCDCTGIRTHVPRFLGYQLNHRGDRVKCNNLAPSPTEMWFRGISVGGSFRRV